MLFDTRYFHSYKCIISYVYLCIHLFYDSCLFHQLCPFYDFVIRYNATSFKADRNHCQRLVYTFGIRVWSQLPLITWPWFRKHITFNFKFFMFYDILFAYMAIFRGSVSMYSLLFYNIICCKCRFHFHLLNITGLFFPATNINLNIIYY